MRVGEDMMTDTSRYPHEYLGEPSPVWFAVVQIGVSIFGNIFIKSMVAEIALHIQELGTATMDFIVAALFVGWILTFINFIAAFVSIQTWLLEGENDD